MVMSNEDHRSPLSRPLRIDEIAEGTAAEIGITTAERAAVAQLLDLSGLKDLTFRYCFHRGAGGRLLAPEPIAGGEIDLGPIIYEPLATALDPYPKREGARFQWSQGGAEGQGEEGGKGPFAALAKLKRGCVA